MKQVSPATHIMIKGARQHNLKNVSLDIPKNQLVVITGLSGSGKSSLAFDTIYAEGQRKYVESLSAYARQFLGLMHKPDVDQIEGLSPSISIDQKTTSHNPRSTVGTITEIYDYLRLLFARIGHPHCPSCSKPIAPQSVDQITETLLDEIKQKTRAVPTRWLILSPLVKDKRGEYVGLFKNLLQKGLNRVRVDGQAFGLNDDIALIKTNKHTIEAVIDRISVSAGDLKGRSKIETFRNRLANSVQTALELADGQVIVTRIHDSGLEFPKNPKEFDDTLYSQSLACPDCNISLPEIEPRLFSFNTPHGACVTCSGLGTLLKIDPSRLVAPDISLSEGAVIPLANAFSNNTWLAKKITQLVEAMGSNIKVEYKKLPDEVKNAVMNGSSREYVVEGKNASGRMTQFKTRFEGVVKELERRYEQTESDFIRKQIESYMTKEPCPECLGARLKPEALAVSVAGRSIADVVAWPINKAYEWINTLYESIQNPKDTLLNQSEKTIADMVVREIKSRLEFLTAVGLDYLTLEREAGSLAGGEAQRIRLASQIGTGLTGVLYVLDEPTIGLHSRDNDRLIQTLKNLKALGNSVIVVEHDKALMKTCDQLIDIGPRAGEQGGKVVFQGSPEDIYKHKNSITGKYLSGKKTVNIKKVKMPDKPKDAVEGELKVLGCKQHNLKDIDVAFPLGKLVVITGVSGSGKSTLMHDTLYPALKLELDQKVEVMGKYRELRGAGKVHRVGMIDQSPIGRTPRSNPVTYTKAFDYIRQVFANTQTAKQRGFNPGRFSFNVKGGRCEACRGDGQVKISMQFLPDVYVTCDVCKGKRYNNSTLGVLYKDKSIAQVLDMTVAEAVVVFKNHRNVVKKLQTLKDVGLGYIKLGQPAPTLSGGEAQRIKLARELSVVSPQHTVYLLDEPTTGLHFEDINNLLVVLKKLTLADNTVIVIEHNLDVIANADYVVDLGPEGGDGGGEVIACGTPRQIAQENKSYTGRYLRELQAY